jgi:transposase
MITREYLAGLSHEEKDEIILQQAARIRELEMQVSRLEARIATFEAHIARLEAMIMGKKTSKNSSNPPSRDQKANIPGKKKKRRDKSVGRAGHARDLHPDPDETLESKLKKCGQCGGNIGEDDHDLNVEYDKIEIPLIHPKVTRVRLYSCTCKTCGVTHKAPAPQGFEEGSPFGNSIEGLITYIRYNHHVSYKRLNEMFSEVFGLSISQGAIANIFKRLNARFDPTLQAIIKRIQSSRIVYSDETSARVKGKNEWEWVFQNDQVVLHVIRPSRGAQVVEEIMGHNRPTYWVSDLYSAQKNHGQKWQICLAHQLRDCQAGIEGGDQNFSWRMKRLFLRAIALSKRRPHLKAETCKAYRRKLEQDLDYILGLTPSTKTGERLKKRYLKNRDSLFTFFEDSSIEPTNNSSERQLRPSVIFRKVTNGFRSDWGPNFFSAVRSLVGTGQRQGLNPYQAIQKALNPNCSFIPIHTSL